MKINSLRLAISKSMEEKGEHDTVRVPLRFREAHLGGELLEALNIKREREEKFLKVKKSKKEDSIKQRKKYSNRQITLDQLKNTVFVSETTFRELVKNNRKLYDEDCYISDDIENLTLGSDPEFGLISTENGKLMYASRTGALPYEGKMGHDGPLAEIRPAPMRDVGEAIEEIKQIFKDNSRRLSPYTLLAGATYKNENNDNNRIYTMGGHIHIGDPPSMPVDKIKDIAYIRIIQILDDLIALPMVMMDTPNAEVRRNYMWRGYGNYGRYGDQRPQVGRFEWRVLSGVWLCHPEVARSVLGTTKAVSEAVYQDMLDKGWKFNYINHLNADKCLVKTFKCKDFDVVKNLVNKGERKDVPESVISDSANRLKSLCNYSKYKAEIDSFCDLVTMSDSDRDKINLNLRDTWIDSKSSIFK